jgi:predicted nucleic acid-binding protein
LPVTRSVVEKTLELCEKYHITKQRYFDTQLVALMVCEGVRTVITENSKDFLDFTEIEVWNPFE